MTCNVKGCNQTASFGLRISVPAKDWPIDMHTPAHLILSLEVCEAHRAFLSAKEFLELNPKLRTMVEVMLLGKQPPDFDRAFVEALPLDHPDILRMKA